MAPYLSQHTTYVDIGDLLRQKIAYDEYFNPEPPLIACRRPKNLHDKLVSSNFEERGYQRLQTMLQDRMQLTPKHQLHYNVFGHKARVHFQDKPQIRLLFSMGNLYDEMQNLQATYYSQAKVKENNIRFNNQRSHIRRSKTIQLRGLNRRIG